MSFSNPLVTCPTNLFPATRYVEFVEDLDEPDVRHYLLVCNGLTCLERQVQEAEAFGTVVDVLPLTREVAEAVSGLDLGEQVTS